MAFALEVAMDASNPDLWPEINAEEIIDEIRTQTGASPKWVMAGKYDAGKIANTVDGANGAVVAAISSGIYDMKEIDDLERLIVNTAEFEQSTLLGGASLSHIDTRLHAQLDTVTGIVDSEKHR